MSALYTEETLLQTFFITFIVGCGCAWQAGRSIAQTWRPLWAVIRGPLSWRPRADGAANGT